MENIVCEILGGGGGKTISIPWPKRTGLRPDVVSVVRHTGVKLLDFFTPVFSCIYC